MKAQLKPRIELEGRTPLETVIPLETPFVLFVDPANTCNFRCRFCPTGNRELIKETGRHQGLLALDIYKKAIDDLHEFSKPLKTLRLYKEGEPLLNPHFAEMVRYAKQSGKVDKVDTTTNGALLKPALIDQIIEAGLDRINISVDGLSDAQFQEFTRTKVDFTQFLENIRYLYDHKGQCEICIKTPGDNLSPEDQQRFFDLFGNYADRIFLENFAPCWPEFEFDGLEMDFQNGIYGQPIREVSVCPYIFYSMTINSDGSVSLCFLDWARKLIVGDVRKQSVKDIWLGAAMNEHRIAHLKHKRKDNATCAGCGQLSHCLPDDIDKYAEQLLSRFTDK